MWRSEELAQKLPGSERYRNSRIVSAIQHATVAAEDYNPWVSKYGRRITSAGKIIEALVVPLGLQKTPFDESTTNACVTHTLSPVTQKGSPSPSPP